MAVITAVATPKYLEILSRLATGETLVGWGAGQTPTFKVGGGGWYLDADAITKLRRTPESSLLDIDAIVDLSRGVGTQRYPAAQPYLEKAVTGAALTYLAPDTVIAQCDLTGFEFVGNDIWEIGIFVKDPDVAINRVMIAYGTVPKQAKAGLPLSNTVNIIVAGA